MDNQESLNFSSWILEDLKKSGLSNSTIEEMKIEELRSTPRVKDILGFGYYDNHPILQLSDCYAIPYTGVNFTRVKIRQPQNLVNLNAKYLSPKKSNTMTDSPLYFLAGDSEKVKKVKYPLIITEGEKKTAKLSQELKKLAKPFSPVAVGIPGVTMGEKSLEGLNFSGRMCYIAFDSDFKENPSVASELLKLFLMLRKRKANVAILTWEGAKGIDDYLVMEEAKGKDPAIVLQALLHDAVNNPFDLMQFNIQQLADILAKVFYTKAEVKAIISEFTAKNSVDVKSLVSLVEERKKQLTKKSKAKEQDPAMPEGQLLKVVKVSEKKAFVVTESGVHLLERKMEHSEITADEAKSNPLPFRGAISGHWSCQKICDDPVIVSDRAQVAEEEKSAYVTLQWNNNEIIVPMSYLQAKNSDKLADRGLRILSTLDARSMTEYFQASLKDIPTRTVYKRLGWHKDKFIIPGHTEKRAILPEATLHYEVKSELGYVSKGMQALEAGLFVCKDFAFFPLMLTSLFAPAAKLLGLESYKFCPFAIGQTGNYKTTLAKQAVMIYGEELGRNFIRFGEGATVAGIIKTCATAGDLPILIDNYKPNLGGGEQDLLKIIQSVVEGKDKLRLDQQGNFRPATTLDAWAIITGEAGIESDTSAVARCVEVKMEKASNASEHLSVISENEMHLPKVGSAWLNWLSSQEGHEKIELVRPRWKEVNKKWNEKATKAGVKNSGRVAANLSCLEIAFLLLTSCFYFFWLKKYSPIFYVMLDVILERMAVTTTEAREGVRFLEALSELIGSGGAVIGGHRSVRPNPELLKPFIGWDNPEEGVVYLLPKTALQAARRLSEFKITMNALYQQLDELAAIAEKDSEHTCIRKTCGGVQQRVLCIERKSLIKDEE